MEHHEPTSNVPTDASERRITTPIPVAPAILMAAVLAATTALLLCVWLFTDIGAGHLLEAVILGLGLPLLTIGALFYYSALARRLHVYSEGKHADRQSEHAGLDAKLDEVLALLRAGQPTSHVQTVAKLDEMTGCFDDLAERVEQLESRKNGSAPVGIFRPRR